MEKKRKDMLISKEFLIHHMTRNLGENKLPLRDNEFAVTALPEDECLTI